MKDTYKDRQKIIQVVFLLASCLLLFKAMQIQLLDTRYQDRARTTAIAKNILYPSRGLIIDRKNKLLVNNNAMYDLKVIYNLLDPEMDTLAFCDIVDISVDEFKEGLNKNFRSARYSKSVPFVFKSKMSGRTVMQLQERLYQFPGFTLQLRNVRGYPHRNAAHVLGYLSEVNRSQIEKSNGVYAGGDYIGSTGLEAYYEEELRGKKGIQFILKDNLGRRVGPYKDGSLDSAAVSGLDLISSLDLDLQRYAEKLLANKTGSIVAIEPSTGEILAMTSAPQYDPNALAINSNRGAAFNELLQDSLKPFLDRSIMAEYPPGSIFKTVVALAAMEEKLMTPYQSHVCKGAYFYKNTSRGCHNHSPPYNLSIALQHSCNTYFFHTIRKIIDKDGFYNPAPGMDLFSKYCYDFGLGQQLGIDLPNEAKGNVPTTEYYDYLYPSEKGSWKSPTVMSIGIGQGEIQMTTLQMANLAAIMANRGHYYPPHLVKEFRKGNERIPIKEKYRTRKEIPVDPSLYTEVIQGMEKVVQVGTAMNAKVEDISICGKTGTSQNPHGKDHSVFFAFAPKENPKIALAVYVEHGVWGSSYASPIASLIIEKYLNGEIKGEPRKRLETKMINAVVNNTP